MSLLVTSSNSDYHSNRTHLSSSALKLLLEDAPAFERKYILNEVFEEEKEAFTFGNLVHTLILEPHKLDLEYAVYPGLRRAGKEFESFKANVANGRKIVTAVNLLKAQQMATKHMKHSTAVDLMVGALPEHNLFGSILDIPVKIRTDAIVIEAKRIIDLKTTGEPSGPDFFIETIKQYSYDLSAALYCEVAEQNFGAPFDFYWELLSKADGGLEIYKMSAKRRAEGKAKLVKALLLYKHCLSTGKWVNEMPARSYDSGNYEILEI